MAIVLSRATGDIPAALDSFLAERVERNIQATLLFHARAGRVSGEPPIYAWQLDEEPRFFVLRIPPWPLLVADLDPTLAKPLLERWLEQDALLPGVSGTPAAALAIAAAYEQLSGARSERRMAEAIHVLRTVIPPAEPPRGELRVAQETDRQLLVEWERAFAVEANLPPGAAALAEATIARRLASGAQMLWEDDGPASTLVLSPAIGGTVRIGPVYTPPQRRNRGYASVAVARACEATLTSGARQCMLYTDLSNPTSNKIYAALGFERCGEWEELSFFA
jgi:RimJ/RimL family protein N-acetyltransferase